MKTLIVNAFGGPGVGKTTASWKIASELKRNGILTEYVSEYAKELVYEEDYELLDGSLEHQKIIYAEQKRRIDRLIGKVNIVVTDSPLILRLCYTKEYNKEFEEQIINDFKSYNNFNLIILRNKNNTFEQAGRMQTLKESIKLDNTIKELLDKNEILYGTYYQSTLDYITQNVIKTYNRLI